MTIDFEPLVQDRGCDHIMLERVIKYINVKGVAVYLELRLVTLRCGHQSETSQGLYQIRTFRCTPLTQSQRNDRNKLTRMAGNFLEHNVERLRALLCSVPMYTCSYRILHWIYLYYTIHYQLNFQTSRSQMY